MVRREAGKVLSVLARAGGLRGRVGAYRVRPPGVVSTAGLPASQEKYARYLSVLYRKTARPATSASCPRPREGNRPPPGAARARAGGRRMARAHLLHLLRRAEL